MSVPMSKMPVAKTVMARAKDVALLFTCDICHRIKRNYTAINECLHSFCKKCMIKKLAEEKRNSCPICNTDLCCFPLDKLRRDHNFQSLIAILFHSIKENTKDPDVSERKAKETVAAQAGYEEPEKPSIQKSASRKKRSLSSFVNTPNISWETLPTGKRKRVPNKFPSFNSSEERANIVEDSLEIPKSSIFRNNARNRKQKRTPRSRQKRSEAPSEGVRVCAQTEVEKVEECPESSTSPIFRRNERNRKQLNISQPSEQQVSCKDAGQGDVWDLNCLAEGVDTTKGSKSRSQGIIFKTPSSTIPKGNPHFSEDKRKECGNTSNYIILDDEDPTPALVPSTSVEQKRKAQGSQRRFVAPSEGVRISAQAVVDANASKNIGLNVVWLSLVATCRQDVGPPLPHIPNCYLRIKDIHSPVSVTKKYLVHKLNLESEDEVEIELLGRPIPSNMEIHKLVEMWDQAVSERISTSVGNSARDLVIVLSYSRKA